MPANLSRGIGTALVKTDPGGIVKCVIRVRAESGRELEREEVEGFPTEWNHNLLTGGWKRGAGKARSKGGYDSISLVTTGNDYSPPLPPLSSPIAAAGSVATWLV